ncbi:hypothetical protein [Steroidobacter sp.]|uniref:hypothetical protein n=1 Tax=Steroidobacter sp. TaxID=1978227 RepID=UPI001A4BD2DA|nr:hypothetical protein [Steroidobacter sp.]MBL8268089.1 hypothetical protein [Steroidobacter sp.]
MSHTDSSPLLPCARVYRVLRADRASAGCPAAGSLVHLSANHYGSAEDDTHRSGIEHVACSIHPSGLPFFTIPKADLEIAPETAPTEANRPAAVRYCVVQYFVDGNFEYVRRGVDAQAASEAAAHYATSVGAQIGTTQRVIVTDSADCLCWDWRYGRGVVYPPLSASARHGE